VRAPVVSGAGVITLEEAQCSRDLVVLRARIVRFTARDAGAGKVLHQEVHEKLGLQLEHVLVEDTVGQPVAFNGQVKVARFAGVIALGLLKELKEPVNRLVEVLPLSNGVVEVDPVVVFANVAHDQDREYGRKHGSQHC
jgi:hypothetical protein